MRLSLFMLVLFFQTNTYAQSSDVSIPFDNYQYTIKGTFLKAEKPNGTAVLIIAGSGPTDRDCNSPVMKSNAYKYLAEHFASKGISSLRYDKLGIAKSTPGKLEKDFIFSDNVDVAAAVYDFLSQQDGVERIVILGHSEGSLVGMLTTQKVSPYKFISLAGPGYPADEILKVQLGKLPDEKIKSEAMAMIDTLKMGKPVTKFNKDLFSLFRPGMNNYLMDWFKYDPKKELSKITFYPTLIIQGDNDIQVSVDNANRLVDKKMYVKKYTPQKVILKDVNHVLKIAPKDFQENYKSYNSPDKDIAAGMKKALVEFILE